ncbi:MAG: histidine phosphatase family protein [Chloroflexi bacterium]|nr:histidine phosphatase family protein [Chloroflexota bacterium]
MKTLLVMRHAKSSWKREDLTDHDRPLNGRGRRDAPRMGELLADRDLVPDLILASTARRARDTAMALADACGYDGQPLLSRQLYGADPERCLSLLRQLGGDAERVLLVAHNPGMAELVDQLTDRFEDFPTAALACIVLPIESWDALDDTISGDLIALWRPRELDRA